MLGSPKPVNHYKIPNRKPKPQPLQKHQIIEKLSAKRYNKMGMNVLNQESRVMKQLNLQNDNEKYKIMRDIYLSKAFKKNELDDADML